MPFFTTRNNENKKMEDKASLLPSSVHAFQEYTQCFPWTISLYGVIFGSLEELICNTFIYIFVKFSSTPDSVVVLAATITYVCFWTIGVFGVFCYCFSLQLKLYNQRQWYLFCGHFMGGCSVGSMLTSVILSFLFFPTRAPLLLLYTYLMPCIGYLACIKIMVHSTIWIHHGCCDGWEEEEEESLKKKDKGEMTTVQS
jgi:hypothetical protein